MYLPVWVIIIAIILGVYFYNSSKNKKNRESELIENDDLSVDFMWEFAEGNKSAVLAESPNLEKYLQDERDMVNAMELDMIRLRERFKYDEKKQREIAQDWMDYSGAVNDEKSASELLDVNNEDTAYDEYRESTKKADLVIQEVSRRVEELLGEKSASKIVHDRLKKKAKSANEILSEK